MRQDPDTKEMLQARYRDACEQFQARKISPDVFRARLYGYGFRGCELEAEVALHWPVGG